MRTGDSLWTELTRLVQSSVYFLNQKQRPVSMDPKRPGLPTYCTMDSAGLDGAIFSISFAVVILQRRKVVKCVQFAGQQAKTERRLLQNAPSGPRVC